MIEIIDEDGLLIVSRNNLDELSLTEEEARSLMICLFNYFEKRDRDVLAQRLTRRTD